MANEGILSGEDVGMILLGKEIQILNLQKQVVALQQQVAALTKKEVRDDQEGTQGTARPTGAGTGKP
jgi:hypothetical protein